MFNQKKYKVASLLAQRGISPTMQFIQNLRSDEYQRGCITEEEIQQYLAWAVQFSKYYKKIDGFVPRQVIKLVNN